MFDADDFQGSVVIDPPQGWLYGFPKFLPEDWKSEEFDLVKWLILNGYPEKNAEWASKNCRYIFKG